jgi:hypothetical protein
MIIIIIIMTYVAIKRAKYASSDKDYQDAWSGRLSKSAILRFSRMAAAFSKVSSERITSSTSSMPQSYTGVALI